MKSIFPERKTRYNQRNLNSFQSQNVKTIFNFTETIAFRGPKIWALVPNELKTCNSLIEFKSKTKSWEPKGCTCRLCKVFIKDLGFI